MSHVILCCDILEHHINNYGLCSTSNVTCLSQVNYRDKRNLVFTPLFCGDDDNLLFILRFRMVRLSTEVCVLDLISCVCMISF